MNNWFDWYLKRDRERGRERKRVGGWAREEWEQKGGYRKRSSDWGRRLPNLFLSLSFFGVLSYLILFLSFSLSPTHHIVELDAKLEAQRVKLLLGCFFRI